MGEGGRDEQSLPREREEGKKEREVLGCLSDAAAGGRRVFVSSPHSPFAGVLQPIRRAAGFRGKQYPDHRCHHQKPAAVIKVCESVRVSVCAQACERVYLHEPIFEHEGVKYSLCDPICPGVCVSMVIHHLL